MNKRAYKFLLLLLVMAGCLVAFALTTANAQQSKETQTQTQLDKVIELDEPGRVRVKFERGGKVAVDNRTTGRITIIGWDQDFIEATATSERGNEAVRAEVTDDASGRRIFLKADYKDFEEEEARGRSSEMRRTALKRQLQSLDLRLESLKARLAILNDTLNQEDVEDRRKELSSSIEKLEARRKELADIIAGFDLQDEPAPTPTPKWEAIPPAPKEPLRPGSTITPPSITSPTKPSISPIKPVTLPPLKIGPPPVFFNDRPREVNIEVKVPRRAEIELIRVYRSDVEVTGIETPLIISGDRSAIKLSRVGAVEVKTGSGNVEIEDASGLVDVITANGAIKVRNAGSDVRALSIGGAVDIQCARGRVDVSTTDGIIRLVGIRGDVDATTTNSEVRFTGAIREDGRYHLKSMSGYVEMNIQATPPGFTVALSSYKGMVSTGFASLLKLKESPQPDQTDASTQPPFSRRLTGRYGDGRTQITLDSFDGVVLLGKGLPVPGIDCK